MDTFPAQPLAPGGVSQRQENLSYKFQRLRERLRQAIVSGEFKGKLPGERLLSRRFDANPKTLGKALTDLAAEGLLERNVGRGTYVKGTSDTASPHSAQGRWMILCDPGQEDSALAAEFQRLHPGSEIVSADRKLRPSLLNQFTTVVDLSTADEALHRTLLVRGMLVLVVGRDSGTYRLSGVLLDRAHAAATLARDLLLGGHRSILVVEVDGQDTASNAVRTAAGRYMPYAAVQSRSLERLDGRFEGISAILCDGAECAAHVREMLATQPAAQGISLAAVGIRAGEAPCTGIYATVGEVARAGMQLLAEAQVNRPVTLWLSGAYVNAGTTHAVAEMRLETGMLAPAPVALSA